MAKNNRKKVLVVTGTRAEYGLLRSSMDAIKAHKGLELKILVTGMHTQKKYGLTQNQIKKDGYKVDAVVAVPAKSDMLQALTKEIEGIRTYCLKEHPDCLLLLGDRDEPFAAAIVALHLNIPVAHMHGGDVTGPGVDETIRHVLSKMAHVHFPGTKKSAQRLVAMGEEPKRIFTFGSPVADVIATQKLLTRAQVAKQLGLDANKPWLAVVQHPTAFDNAPLAQQIKATLDAIATYTNHEIIISYPNSDEGSGLFISAVTKLKGPQYHLFKSLTHEAFLGLVKESDALVGNSSSGIIESGLLGTPAVDVGNRQAGRERGANVLHAGYFAREISVAVHRAIALKKKQKGKAFASPYGKPGVGKGVAETLAHVLLNADLLTKRPPLDN